MALIHSTRPRCISPQTAISISDTVQLPPMKSLSPWSRAARITGRLTGSRTITDESAILKVDAASIQ
jgi:hypothetical protein